MTGIADFYLYLKRPTSKDRRKRLLAHFVGATTTGTNGTNNNPVILRFVVLSWKRTGSNLLCGMLHRHFQVTMHNELFNPIDIFTYHPEMLRSCNSSEHKNDDAFMQGNCENQQQQEQQQQQQHGWSVLTRDLFPVDFLDFIYQNKTVDGELINPNCRAIGFKSFPDHWIDVRNEPVWQEYLLEDFRVKKVILFREDELAVYVSMKRADQTGRYLTCKYPEDLTIYVDPTDFQTFLNNYRNTYKRKYRSPVEKRDTFWITYEQLINQDYFQREFAPHLCRFLGIDDSQPLSPLKETIKQSEPEEDLSRVIANYGELEFCFRHSDVLTSKAAGK